MADVYVAEQVSLGRQVAVKVLRPETLRNPSAVQRFEREARAAAALTHGNIVQIYEVACVDGIHFLAEELVAGPSLKAWLQARGPLAPRQAFSVLAQVGAALVRSAERGIVHRDIKPENLLVTPAGEVKVADFGLARVMSEAVDLTQEGMTLGTPLYMSPEQAAGRTTDVRSDLYSLGATVYHLVAGRPPFAGPSSVSVVMAHLQAPHPPLAEQRPGLPQELCAIVDRLLAKAPHDRYATPLELLHAVEAAESATLTGSRLIPAPLSWTDGDRDLLTTDGHDPRSAAVAGAVTTDMHAQPSAATRSATRHLQAAAEREQRARSEARRRWLATAAAALVALGVGFLVGRSRSRRTDLFRTKR
jgi:serine/threonine-protein kinase